jgi:hypothetical protein
MEIILLPTPRDIVRNLLGNTYKIFSTILRVKWRKEILLRMKEEVSTITQFLGLANVLHTRVWNRLGLFSLMICLICDSCKCSRKSFLGCCKVLVNNVTWLFFFFFKGLVSSKHHCLKKQMRYLNNCPSCLWDLNRFVCSGWYWLENTLLSWIDQNIFRNQFGMICLLRCLAVTIWYGCFFHLLIYLSSFLLFCDIQIAVHG